MLRYQWYGKWAKPISDPGSKKKWNRNRVLEKYSKSTRLQRAKQEFRARKRQRTTGPSSGSEWETAVEAIEIEVSESESESESETEDEAESEEEE